MTIELLATVRNTKDLGGLARKGAQRTVDDRYARALIKQGYAKEVPGRAPKPEPAPEQPRYYVGERSGGWYPVLDRETGERVVGESAQDEDEAEANASRLNDSE